MIVLLVLLSLVQVKPAPKPAPKPTPTPAFFVSALPTEELRNKQAVLETSEGIIVLDLLPEAAPNHVAYFVTQARAGAFDGTSFHRVIRNGMVQGGDPITKDPSQQAKYGTGGLGVLRFEASSEKLTQGAVAAVLIPGRRDSAGSQFIILLADQPTLEGQREVQREKPRRGAGAFCNSAGRRRYGRARDSGARVACRTEFRCRAFDTRPDR